MQVKPNSAPLALDSRELRRPALFGVVLGFGFLFLSFRDLNAYQFGYYPDSITYTLLARSLVEGPHFALALSPGFLKATQFPFGLPALLMPVVLFLPQALDAPQILSLLATALNGGLLFAGWRWFAPGLSHRWRYAVTAMTLLTPITLSASRTILSEPLFTTSVLLAILFAARLGAEPRNRTLWVALGVALFFVVHIRSVGWAFLGSLCAYLAFTRRRAILPALLSAGAVLVLLTAVVVLATPVSIPDLVPEQYLSWYLRQGNPRELEFAAENNDARDPGYIATHSNPLDYVSDHIHIDLRRTLFLTGGGETETAMWARLGASWLNNLPGWSALGLVLLGNLAWARRAPGSRRLNTSPFQFAGLCYLAVILLWRGGGGERLLYPIQPQLYLALLLGILAALAAVAGVGGRWIANPVRRTSWSRRAPRLVLTAVVVSWLALAVYRDLTLVSSYQAWGDLTRRTDAIKQYVPEDALLGSDWSELDHIYTGRPTRDLDLQPASAASLLEAWRRAQIRYVAIAADPSFETLGISPQQYKERRRLAALRELAASGHLTPVYADPFPIQIFRLE